MQAGAFTLFIPVFQINFDIGYTEVGQFNILCTVTYKVVFIVILVV